MAELQNFRIAFNGFHREDVVRYIEQVNAKHTAEISQLNTEIQYLQEKLTQHEEAALQQVSAEELEQKIALQDAAMAEQAQRIAALEAALAQAREDTATAEAQLAQAENESARLQDLLDTALSRQSGSRTQEAAELSAYRRAERVERQAKQRATQICELANGVLADAAVRVDETAAQLASMAEDTLRQIRQLQLAVTGSKQILQDTVVTLSTIRPAGEEE